VTTDPDDELVPVSVRLGEVVPPEDPEDWTRPLTWVAAAGMLAGPLVALAWFVVAPPTGASPVPATAIVAAALAGGAALTGATQQGTARAWTATLGAGLFGSLVVVVLGVVFAGERAVGASPPATAQAFSAALAGLAGSAAAAIAAALTARRGRAIRLGLPFAAGVVVSLLALGALPSG
jgi:hypothetical protein